MLSQWEWALLKDIGKDRTLGTNIICPNPTPSSLDSHALSLLLYLVAKAIHLAKVISIFQCSHPCASSYVTSDHELFSCCLAQTSTSPEGKNLFLEGPYGSWLETLSLKWNHVFWGVESWGCFSGPFCWFGVGEGCRGQALVVVGVPSSCSEDTLMLSPPACQWSCCSFGGGGTSIKVLFALPGQGGWRLCSVASAVYQLAWTNPPPPPPLEQIPV